MVQSTCFELVIFITNHKRPHCQCVLVDRYRLFFLHLPFQSSTLRYNLFYILYLRIIYFFNFTAANVHTLPVFLSHSASALLSISVHNSLYYCFLCLDPEIERVTKKIDCTSFELAFKQKTPQLILSLSIRHPPTINWLE